MGKIPEKERVLRHGGKSWSDYIYINLKSSNLAVPVAMSLEGIECLHVKTLIKT